MQNRFGLKDLILYVLVVAVGVTVILYISAMDRNWQKMESLVTKVTGVETQLARVEKKIEAGGVGGSSGGGAAGSSGGGAGISPEQMNELLKRLDASNARMAEIEKRLAQGGGATGAPGSPTAPVAGGETKPPTGSTTPVTPTNPGARDESWARAGAPIEWQPEPRYTADPSSIPGYRQGGTITEIFEAQTKVLTPSVSTDVYSRRIQEIVLESLGTLNPETLEVEGQLAEAWQMDPKGLWLRARLRPNLRFSDGHPLTSDDVVYGYEYIMNEQIDAERSRSILRDSIKSVKALDERTVEFEFKESLFTNRTNALSIFVLPRHFYTQFSPAQINQSTGLLMGSGPFKVRGLSTTSQWSPPDAVVLERNEQYWGPKPPLGGFRYAAINDELPRLNAFAAGDGDIITPSSVQFAAKIQDGEWRERANFLKWVNMRSGYSFIAWNGGMRNGKLTPFADKRVRRAMTMLLDRQKMIDDIYKGIGMVAKGNMPLASPGANPDIKPWPYDPAAAKALLRECGWDDRNGDGTLEDENGNIFEFEFSYSGGSEIAEKIAKFVKDAYNAAGIKVNLRSADWSVYQDFMKKRDFDAITLGWGANAPESDPIQIFHSKSIANQGDNFAQYNSPEADRLIDAGRREIDTDKRMAIWRQLEAQLHEDQPYTFVRVPPWLRMVRRDIGNVHMYPAGLLYQEMFRAAGPLAPMPAN